MEKGLVSHLDPVNDLTEVFECSTGQLEEAGLAEESVEILEPKRQRVLKSGLVEVNDGLSQGVILKVHGVRAVESAGAGKHQSQWKLGPNVVLLALLVVQEIDEGELVVSCGSGESDCPRLVS